MRTIAPDLIDRLRQRFVGRPTFEYMNIELVDLGLDYCKASIKFHERFDNGGGVIHGGILAMFADTLVALALCTNFDGKMGFATSSMNIHFLKRAKSGVTGTAKIIKKGSTICVGTVEMEDERGDLVAKAICDFILTTSKLERQSRRDT